MTPACDPQIDKEISTMKRTTCSYKQLLPHQTAKKINEGRATNVRFLTVFYEWKEQDPTPTAAEARKMFRNRKNLTEKEQEKITWLGHLTAKAVREMDDDDLVGHLSSTYSTRRKFILFHVSAPQFSDIFTTFSVEEQAEIVKKFLDHMPEIGDYMTYHPDEDRKDKCINVTRITRPKHELYEAAFKIAP